MAEIAEAYGISRGHLMKGRQSLSAFGYLKTTRGTGGGLTLARAPASIAVGNLLRATESGIPTVECVGARGTCRIAAAYSLPGMFAQAIERFYATLDRYTLADLMANPEQLAPLLGGGVRRSERVSSERSRGIAERR